MAIVFDRLGDAVNIPTAMLRRDLLEQDVIEMGQNSWCAEDFDTQLRRAIRLWVYNRMPAKGTGKAELCWPCINRALDDDADYCETCLSNRVPALQTV